MRVSGEAFPRAIQIVDLFQAKEKLWDLARVLGPWPKDQVEFWADAHCDGLSATSRAHAVACRKADQCANDFEPNREPMRYKNLRAQRLYVGSGVVVAGCTSLVGTRLIPAGMSWTSAGAHAIIALRSCILRGRHEDSWEERVPKNLKSHNPDIHPLARSRPTTVSSDIMPACQFLQ